MTTIFTSKTTNHGLKNKSPADAKLMSEQGAAMAAHTAPADAKVIAIGPMKGTDQDAQRETVMPHSDDQIRKRLDENSRHAGQFVDWKKTAIGQTEGARHSDPWANAALSKTNTDGRSVALDSVSLEAVEELQERFERLVNNQKDSSTRAYVVGLHHYLRSLPRGEKPKRRVIEPVLRALVANRNLEEPC